VVMFLGWYLCFVVVFVCCWIVEVVCCDVDDVVGYLDGVE